jgi:hypothetical protein
MMTSASKELPSARSMTKIIPELELAFEEKKFVFTNNIYSDKWGTWVSAFAPVYDIDGSFDAIVGVDIVAEKLAGQA